MRAAVITLAAMMIATAATAQVDCTDRHVTINPDGSAINPDGSANTVIVPASCLSNGINIVWTPAADAYFFTAIFGDLATSTPLDASPCSNGAVFAGALAGGVFVGINKCTLTANSVATATTTCSYSANSSCYSYSTSAAKGSQPDPRVVVSPATILRPSKRQKRKKYRNTAGEG